MTIVSRVVLRALASGLLLASASALGACDRREQVPDSTVVLSWSREGGLAGFCDQLAVTASGDVTASSCSTAGVRRGKLSSGNLARLNGWLAAFGSVTTTSRDAATADAMSLKMTLSGKGQRQPSETERQELSDWAQGIYLQTR